MSVEVIPVRVDLRLQENQVTSWEEFKQKYKKPIEQVNIQLEREKNYDRYKKLIEYWKELNIDPSDLVKEILHNKDFVLIKNDFPPVGLPEDVKVYTFWINIDKFPESKHNNFFYKQLLAKELEQLGYSKDDYIAYMRDQNQMSIPKYPHFHVYVKSFNS